ncbi:MAG: hypothetical protein U9N73_12995 [Candidatus Auribacterota bacterium]|nr:hypothetical protein [Candidatus Auribacterota bacterium]
MANEFEREIGIHGERWESLHGGYFSNPEVAAHLPYKIFRCRAG